MTDRILWNRRPTGALDTGDIDEIVLTDVAMVHVEQMDDRCWWIGIYKTHDGDTPYWMGNFVADSRGLMRFVEQENSDIDWDDDDARGDAVTFVRKTTHDGRPLSLWHVARPMRTTPAGCLTGCGRVVDSPWPTAGTGWTYHEFSDQLPAREERCGANGCRQRWETP